MVGRWQGVIALAGQIPYLINENDLGYRLNYLSNHIGLKFDIGELDLIVSREGLEYTDRTKQAIIGKINLLKEEFASTVTNYLSDFSNLSLAWRFVGTCPGRVCDIIFDGYLGPINYKGVTLRKLIHANCPLEIIEVSRPWSRSRLKKEVVNKLAPGPKIIFNDTERKTGFSLDDLHNKLGSYYFINTDKQTTYEELLEKVPLFQETNMGLDRLSNYWTPEKSTYKPTPKGTLLAYKVSHVALFEVGEKGILCYLKKEYLDPAEPQIYLILESQEVSQTGFSIPIGPFNNPSTQEFFQLLQYIDKPVYAIRKRNEDKIPENWIHFDQALQEGLINKSRDINSAVDLEEIAVYTQLLSNIRCLSSNNTAYWVKYLIGDYSNEKFVEALSKYQGTGTSLAKLLEKLDKIKFSLEISKKINTLATLYKIDTDENSNYQKFKGDLFELVYLINDEYPLLELIINNVKPAEIIPYVQMVDKFREAECATS